MKLKIAFAFTATIVMLAGCDVQPQTNVDQMLNDMRGHTVAFTFEPDKTPNGVEYYYPDSNLVLIHDQQGICEYGRYEVEGEHITFNYSGTGDRSHFEVVKKDGDIILLESSGVYQSYEIVSDKPVDCTPINSPN